MLYESPGDSTYSGYLHSKDPPKTAVRNPLSEQLAATLVAQGQHYAAVTLSVSLTTLAVTLPHTPWGV